MAEQPDDKPKHAGGRPLKYDSVEKLELAINAYFDECDPHVEQRVIDGGVNQKGQTIWLQRAVMTEQKPYTMSGLAVALGVNRGTILNYSKTEEFFSTVEAARDRCAAYAESQLFGPYANGAKFALSNNYSTGDAEWTDKKAVDHTTKGQVMPLLGGTTPMVDEDDDEDGAPADDITQEDSAAS